MKPIEKYGIRLRPLEEPDIEQVRVWRNAPHVRETMEFQTPISPGMQVAWWRGLDPTCNYYYVIESETTPIGVIHAKDINWDAKTAETGIFIGRMEYLNGFVPVLAVLALMDELFEVYGLELLNAKVNMDFAVVMEFNERLGYQRISESGKFCRLAVSKGQYYQSAKLLRAIAAKLGGQ